MKHAASSEPMIENVSGYSRNPCSLNRERDAAFAALIASGTASRHQPMNWHDSITASDIGHAGGIPKA